MACYVRSGNSDIRMGFNLYSDLTDLHHPNDSPAPGNGKRQGMNLWSILKAIGGVFGFLFSGSIWTRLHDRQARHMQDYGDRERNKHGLWK